MFPQFLLHIHLFPLKAAYMVYLNDDLHSKTNINGKIKGSQCNDKNITKIYRKIKLDRP